MLNTAQQQQSSVQFCVMSDSPNNSEKVCSFFDRGKYCRFGKRCKFLHIRSQGNTQNPSCNSKQEPQVEEVKKELVEAVQIQQQSENEVPKLCYYFSRFNRCKFGKGCRFAHIEDEVPTASVKDDDIDVEDKQTEDVADKSDAVTEKSASSGRPARPRKICRYFKAGHCYAGHRCRFYHPLDLIELNDNNETGDDKEVKSVPRSKPRKHQQRSKPTIFVTDEISTEELQKCRDTEIAQFNRRFPKAESNTDENGSTLVQFTFVPSDPDWPYDVKSLPAALCFKKDYPQSMLGFQVLESSEMPESLTRKVTRSVQDWLESRYVSFSSQGKVELAVRPMLRWLDRNIQDMFTTALKQYQKELMAKAAGLQFVTATELQEQYKAGNSAEEEEEDQEEEEEDSEEEEEEEEEESDEEEDESSENGVRRPVTDVSQRGTEVRFINLQLKNSLATLMPTKVCIQVQCERCRGKNALTTPVSRANALACETCSAALTVTFRANMVHEYSAVLGYADVTGCSVFDVVLPDCEFQAGCLACSKEMPLQGVATGQPKDTWCQHCNAKMRLVADSIKFLRLQPAILVAEPEKLHKVDSKPKRLPKDPAIQDGRPLPDDGICKHYKKSYRWFRFPCCGKAYPCDVCHDDKEDHVYTFANRMICGHCCKEQPYASERPCIRCNLSMTKKSTSHWEGGKGCRDKIKMSKDDAKKYSNLNKTISRKSQGIATGKKTTKLRHS